MVESPSEQRSKVMRLIKSKGTKIERAFGKALWAKGFRYRKNDASVYGRPDFTLKKLKIAIFVDSEFWHGKHWDPQKKTTQTNSEFWHQKIGRNVGRDREVNEYLVKNGWRVLRFWGREIERRINDCVDLVKWVAKNSSRIEGKLLRLSDECNQGGAFASSEEEWMAAEEKAAYNKGAMEVKSQTQTRFFNFAELSGGCGAFRYALENLGGIGEFVLEPNPVLAGIYHQAFGINPEREFNSDEVPFECDILCANLNSLAACSQSSTSPRKPNFSGVETLQNILIGKEPKSFLLETNETFVTPRQKKLFECLSEKLGIRSGYTLLGPQVLNAKNFGSPLDFRRTYLIGFRNDRIRNDFQFPPRRKTLATFGQIREKNCSDIDIYQFSPSRNISTKKPRQGLEYEKYYLTSSSLVPNNPEDKKKRIFVLDKPLMKPVFRKAKLLKIQGKNIRTLTAREWARLQGYPDEYLKNQLAAKHKRYLKASPNINVLKALVKQMLPILGIVSRFE